MPQVSEAEVFRACRTLFGSELNLSHEFLAYLQPAGVRSAYRKKAKVIHPDRFAVATAVVQEKQHRLFQDLNQAHETVLCYLKQRRTSAVVTEPKTYTPPRPQPAKPQQHQQYQHRGDDSVLLPNRPLQFGMFLYHLKLIPFNTLIRAIIWQRQQRPAIGEIAKRWGWLTDEGISRILQMRSGLNKFGERAELLGLLSPQQVRTLLFYQRSQQKQLGLYFVEHGYFDDATLQELLAQLADHNRACSSGINQQFYYFHRK